MQRKNGKTKTAAELQGVKLITGNNKTDETLYVIMSKK